MSNLRFLVMVRRKGQSIHDSDKFQTEEFESRYELKEAVNHYIDVQYDDEEQNGAEDDNS